MKSDYRVRACKFFESIYPYIKDCLDDPAMCKYAMQKYNHQKSRKVQVFAGYTRIAFLCSDYVIKLDYNPREIYRVGGCESEVTFYQFAKEQGFAYLLAEISRHEYMGITFYVMPRISGMGRVLDRYAEDFFEGEERIFIDYYLRDLHDENYGWYNKTPVIFDYACNTLWLEDHREEDYYTFSTPRTETPRTTFDEVNFL